MGIIQSSIGYVLFELFVMADQPASLPNTLAECHALLQTQQATIDQQQEVIDQQQEVLKALQREVALLKRAIFGRRREPLRRSSAILSVRRNLAAQRNHDRPCDSMPLDD